MSTMNDLPLASDGDIYYVNHCAELHNLWNAVSSQNNPNSAYGRLLDMELLSAQFFADYQAYDRLIYLSNKRLNADPDNPEAYLFAARVYTATHRFSEAELAIAQARETGCPEIALQAMQLTIDQAIGKNIDTVFQKRLSVCDTQPSISNLVALGSLTADLGHYKEAETLYKRALNTNANLSPIGYAWACFQLGVLFGETYDEPDLDEANLWYSRALHLLPNYVLAAVHLAEVKLEQGNYDEAQQLLLRVNKSDEPEVKWRYAEVLMKIGQSEAAEESIKHSYAIYKGLLRKHKLAFADHACQFLIENQLDPNLALDLAFSNLDNRKTKQAYDLVYRAAGYAAQSELA